MSNWMDNKGAGVWAFEEQKNKWGYLNNPRWMKPAGAPVSYDGREDEEPQVWSTDLQKGSAGGIETHIPCGHWHKEGAPALPLVNVNLYRVTDPWLSYGAIQSLYFDTTTKTLTFVKNFRSSPGVCGLEVVAQSVFTIQSEGADARLLELDKDLNILTESDVFTQYDCESPRAYHVAYYDGFLYCVSDDPVKITKISYPGFSRIGRYTPGTVFIASDGTYYAWTMYNNTGWGTAQAYPLTGDPLYYDSWTEKVDGNDHDGDVQAWGVGDANAANGSVTTISIHNNTVYFINGASPNPDIHANNGTDFSRTGTVNAGNKGVCVYCSTKNYVYSAAGVWDEFYINRFTTGLSPINNTFYSDRGRVQHAYQICELGDYIVVGTLPYTGTSGIFLLNPDLSFVSYYDGVTAQAVSSSGNFLFVGLNTAVHVYELVGDQLIFCDEESLVDSAEMGSVTKWLKLMQVA